ncbi:MAG: Rne/Rng family ribonuclease [Desulfosarcina sp.]|nr:Rne/Rng family ribonuclease [Desulfobacterales bacterium]
MYKEIIINVSQRETRVALLEDGTLVELFIERDDATDITGNIYKGRVQRVLPGIQAAFVNIGLNQAAFIYVDDVIRNDFRDIERQMARQDPETTGREDQVLPVPDEVRSSPIEELLVEGQEILVHVTKAPMGTKGPRVTSYVSLPGRYLVLMPFANHIGVSRRIEDEAERLRLKNIIAEIRDNHFGYIVRTAAEGSDAPRVQQEMLFLKNLWASIRKKFKHAAAPALIHQELSLSLRAVRDLLVHEADRLMIDPQRHYETAIAFLDTFNPGLKNRIELDDGSEPIFDAFNLEGDITRALKRKVWLKSGGYIIIEHTEALVAIDVNTGRYVGKHNLEETIFKTNLEAVKEIAYQIRLRDIGGLIIIDFIDMQKKSNQEKVYNALKDALRKDRSKNHVLPISDMGLVQMTRKRNKEPLTRIMCEPCVYCEGEGHMLSRQSICYNIFREVLRESRDTVGEKMAVIVNPAIADLLHGEESELIAALEGLTGRQIVIYPDTAFHMEEVNIIEILKEGAPE